MRSDAYEKETFYHRCVCCDGSRDWCNIGIRIHAKWGKPDGHLSGFWDEIWFLNEEKDGRITLYYDEDGKIDDVVVDVASGKTTEK